MESPNQEKITGRLCAIGRAEYTNLIGGAGYKFIENGGFKWELDPADIDRYGISMDALLDCVEQLEKMGTIEQIKASEHFKGSDGWRNAGIVIQSKLDPRVVCSVELVGNEYDKSEVSMRWFVDLEKESKAAVGAPEHTADPEELKAVERAQEMSKDKSSDKKDQKESIDHLFDLPIRSTAKTGVKQIKESVDGWGLPTLGESELEDGHGGHVGDQTIGEKPKPEPGAGKEYGEKDANGNIVKPGTIAKDPELNHVEGNGGADPTLELDLPANKIKPGTIAKDPELNHMEEAKDKEAKAKAEKEKAEKEKADKAKKLKEDAGGEKETKHVHPADRKAGDGKSTGDVPELDSDNDGHITQEKKLKETGEPDQDYDKEALDKVVEALKNDGFQASHREFDKYQGIYLKVSKNGKTEKFWMRDVDHLKEGGVIIHFQPESGKEEQFVSCEVSDEAFIGDLVEFMETGKTANDEEPADGSKDEPKKEESIIIHKGSEANKSASGIHLIGVKSEAIKEAKEYAVKTGAKHIYIHRDGPKFGAKTESRSYIAKGGRMLQVEDNDVYVGVKALETPKDKADDGKNREEVDGAGKVKDKNDGADNKSPEHMDGGGQSQVGGTDKEDALAAAKIKPGAPEAAPKLMAERKKMREAAMKRREERKASDGKVVESQKAPGKKLSEGYDHPQKVMDGLKRHMDEAHRAVRKGHEMTEWAHKKMHECMESMPHPLAAELGKHHEKMNDAKIKLNDAKRSVSEVCEDIDRLHRHSKRK